jgi:hypothetical protein
MNLIDLLVEQRMAAAIARGEFDHLPGAGAPLQFDDDLLTPEETRLTNRILKNAGALPPVIEKWRELRAMRQQARSAADNDAQRHMRLRILALDMALESLRGSSAVIPKEYRRQLAERLAGQDDPPDSDDLAG